MSNCGTNRTVVGNYVLLGRTLYGLQQVLYIKNAREGTTLQCLSIEFSSQVL